MKKAFLVFLFFLIPIPLFSLAADSLQIGDKAPSFFIESADGKKLNLEMIIGNLSLIFYEDRSVVEKKTT